MNVGDRVRVTDEYPQDSTRGREGTVYSLNGDSRNWPIEVDLDGLGPLRWVFSENELELVPDLTRQSGAPLADEVAKAQPDDLTHYMEAVSRLKAQLAQVEQERDEYLRCWKAAEEENDQLEVSLTLLADQIVKLEAQLTQVARDRDEAQLAYEGALGTIANLKAALADQGANSQQEAGRGCERHRGDPHNLCVPCMEAGRE